MGGVSQRRLSALDFASLPNLWPAPGGRLAGFFPLAEDQVRVNAGLILMPLGGLGEIGMNCLALEQVTGGAPERILIDCGVTFPSDDNGVELIHPRFDAILEAPKALRALVVTHGHEDHIGAIPYLLEALAKLGAPPLAILGPPYALELSRDRLLEVGVDESTYRMRAIAPGERVAIGGFEVEPVRVTHSIVDATALILRTHAGTVIHSGDFKLEAQPLDGQPTDEARLARAGDDGVRLLLSDSTNVFQAGYAGGELEVATALEGIVGAATGRVVVGLFASNVHRLGALAGIARRVGRHLCLLGRSVRRHADVGRRLGWLDWPSELVVAPEIAANLPARRVLYLATGTQAEPRGALWRLATGQHSELRLGAGDLVVMSSRVIPGAERAVFAMQDALVRNGVKLVTRTTDPGIHVSGHAHRGEQERLIELVRPASFVPVHGTLQHLLRHAELARSLGVDDTWVMLNGDRIELGAEPLKRLGSVVSGQVSIAGGWPLGPEVLRQRRELGRAGLVVVVLGVEGEHRLPVVYVVASGVLDAPRTVAVATAAAREVLSTKALANAEGLSEVVRRTVRQRLHAATGQRPVVDVQVLPGDGAPT